MVADLNVPVQIVTCPTVRDTDGLALSSRNDYLTPAQRPVALAIHRSMQAAAEEIQSGQVDAHQLMAEMRQYLIDNGITKIDYAVIAHPETLEVVDSIRGPVVLLIAAYVDETRLIDNCLIR
jgi:pantoate--beta-alanine ligase